MLWVKPALPHLQRGQSPRPHCPGGQARTSLSSTHPQSLPASAAVPHYGVSHENAFGTVPTLYGCHRVPQVPNPQETPRSGCHPEHPEHPWCTGTICWKKKKLKEYLHSLLSTDKPSQEYLEDRDPASSHRCLEFLR